MMRRLPGLRRKAAWRCLQAILVLVALAAGVVLWRGWHVPEVAEPGDSQSANAEVLARGAYLVRIGACMGCHTAAGGQVLAGGGEVRTSFGNFFAPNLTPDAETGIGAWSVKDFRKAMRHGVAPGGLLLYPAFPYEQYTFLTDGDIDAIYHYLQSIPAIQHRTPPHRLRFPYGTQIALAAWRGLYFRPALEPTALGNAKPEQKNGAASESGQYLVQAVTHCAACHSPRNGLGALGGGQRLDGGWMAVEGWQAPSLLDSHEAGVQQWSVSDVVQFLRTGHTAGGATASGPMADAVFWSTQYLTERDAAAIAVYLKDLPDAVEDLQPQLKTSKNIAAHVGNSRVVTLYEQYCAACHGVRGEGQLPAYPPLAGNRAVVRADPGNVLRSMLQGGYAPTTIEQSVAPHGMPPFMQTLSDADIAALASYIRQSWGNSASAVATIDAFRARQGQP